MMIDQNQITQAKRRAASMLDQAGIALTDKERSSIEIADFGLGELDQTGLEIVVYENNERYCAKELVLFPRQTCPEHRHPPRAETPGKQETFRVRKGIVWLYVPGPVSATLHGRIPSGAEKYYTVFHEVQLLPGDQYTLPPGTKHWFQSGDEGAIVSEFSSPSDDASDIFTDPRITR